MMILFVTVFLLFFMGSNYFTGNFLILILFFVFLGSFNMFGVESMKGELFGGLGFDFISYYLVLLLLWLVSLILVLFYSWGLAVLLMLLLLSMSFMFVSLNVVYLFIYFEFSMLPMFLIIMFFGSSKERYSAGMYMFIYTMVSSLPMLVVLMYFGSSSGSLSMDFMSLNILGLDGWVVIAIIFMFLVKVPMFLVHIWLPKAHVEAPVFGSMILASVMLKMGGYGVIRVMDFMMIDLFIYDFFFCFCLCGAFMISYICLFQVDLKVLVAYSSIAHMSIMLSGFFGCSELGYLGGIIMMLSHGICSSGMFYLVNEIYNISGSRLLLLNKGLMGVSPVLSWMWLFMLIDNLGAPPCFGILGELMLVGGCLFYSWVIFFMFFLIIFFISCFVVNMFSLLVSGELVCRGANVSVLIYFGGIMHLLPLNFLIFFMGGCV